MFRRLTCGDDAPDLLAGLGVEVGPSVDYHHDLSAHHTDRSPPSLIWIWVSPRRRQRVVKHKCGSLEADAVRSKVRIILYLIPNPTQAQSPFTVLRNCSYGKGSESLTKPELVETVKSMELKSVSSVFNALAGGREDVGSKVGLASLLKTIWDSEYEDERDARFINDRVHANVQRDGTLA